MESIIPQIIANSIIAGSVYFLMSLGFNLIFGTAKFLDIGYGVLTAVGSYTVFWFLNNSGVGFLGAILFGVILGGLLSLVIEKIVYQKLRKKKSSNMVMLVASLGVLTFIQAIIAMIFTSQFQTLRNGESNLFNMGGAIFTEVQLWIIGLALSIFAILLIVLKFTSFGKAVKAVSDDEEVAKIVGINTDKIISKVFFIGGSIGALAGIMIGLDTGIEPTMGFALLLKGVIASIIGGVGSLGGGFLGAYLLAFVENFGIMNISSEWKDAIAFALLIIFLIFRPNGIVKK